MTEEIDPLSVKRTFEQAFNSTTFETTQTTTFSKGTGSQATRQEVIGRDGSLLRIVGTATQPVRFEHGVEQESGVWRRFTKEIKLDAAHQDTPELKKTYVDMAGRAYKTVYAPDGTAHEQTWYDTSGRTSGRRDLDGVVTLYQYNSLGELEYSAIDLKTNGVIDLGSDRVTRTVSDVIASGAYATNVRRQRTYEYRTTGNSTESLKSLVESTPDGLKTWRAVDGVLETSTAGVADASGSRAMTNVTAGGRTSITMYRHGRTVWQEVRESGGTVIGRTDYEYDAHGRQSRVIDLRSGPTTYAYDLADRVVSVSLPPSGNSDAPQVTSTPSDPEGRATAIVQPDRSVVTNEVPEGRTVQFLLPALWSPNTAVRANIASVSGRGVALRQVSCRLPSLRASDRIHTTSDVQFTRSVENCGRKRTSSAAGS